jgi:nucleotide-binding universal stress UspA family protein
LFKKILAPVDGSEPADRALKQACELAEKFNAEIKILNVVDRPLVYAGTYPGMVYPRPYIMGTAYSLPYGMPAWAGTYSEKLRDSNKMMLEEARKKAEKEHPGIGISTELVEGKTADKIVEASKDGNFDLIVMGSRGFGGVEELLLGSVSHGVVNKAECPVLIVK